MCTPTTADPHTVATASEAHSCTERLCMLLCYSDHFPWLDLRSTNLFQHDNVHNVSSSMVTWCVKVLRAELVCLGWTGSGDPTSVPELSVCVFRHLVESLLRWAIWMCRCTGVPNKPDCETTDPRYKNTYTKDLYITIIRRLLNLILDSVLNQRLLSQRTWFVGTRSFIRLLQIGDKLKEKPY